MDSYFFMIDNDFKIMFFRYCNHTAHQLPLHPKKMNKLYVLIIGCFFLSTASVKAQFPSIMMTYYGTGNDAARAKTMDILNDKIAKVFPNSTMAEAYTSDMVIKSLKKRGINKLNVGEALKELRLKKQRVIIANCQLLDGVMTDKLINDVRISRGNTDSIIFTKPLLYNSDDCHWLVSMLLKHIHVDKNTELVLVGHGSDDSSNAIYSLVDYIMQNEVDKRFHVGTIENYPDLAMIKRILKKDNAKKVILYPLLLIAGNHAVEDIDGKWRQSLENEGYDVKIINQGLLEIPEVQDRIVEKIRNAMN